jgi:hypothetical protein
VHRILCISYRFYLYCRTCLAPQLFIPRRSTLSDGADPLISPLCLQSHQNVLKLLSHSQDAAGMYSTVFFDTSYFNTSSFDRYLESGTQISLDASFHRSTNAIAVTAASEQRVNQFGRIVIILRFVVFKI